MIALAEQGTAPAPLLPASEAGRVRLAAHPGTPMSTLRLLADDHAVMVRAAVALNPAYDRAVGSRLVVDTDERVRALLAGKVARLLPGLSSQEQKEAQVHVHDMLLALARDAATRVRVALADALRAMPQAPRAVIMLLAQDSLASVSEPILRLSPLLTDADLLEILAAPPHPAAATAVAGRTRLSNKVADAIALRADAAAVKALLQNGSAMIRESTLDNLIGRAGEHPDWHQPLTQRPWLPEHAARALSLVVTGHLLEFLLERSDLPASVADEIRGRTAANPTPVPIKESELLAQVQRQHGANPIRERTLIEAAAAGESRRVAMILAVTSRVPLERVDHAVAVHNVKGLVSLVWRAGFSMAAAQSVQSALGAFAPGEALMPAQHESFPLCADEMEWQVGQLASSTG